jgi:endonuclease YncB( thermonuclease family)
LIRARNSCLNCSTETTVCRGDDSSPYHCGAQAANDLDAFIASRPVSCLPISLDRYGRTVATCAVGGADLGDWLVRNGLALDWPEYSKRKTMRLNAMLSRLGEAFGKQLPRAVVVSGLHSGEWHTRRLLR